MIDEDRGSRINPISWKRLPSDIVSYKHPSFCSKCGAKLKESKSYVSSYDINDGSPIYTIVYICPNKTKNLLLKLFDRHDICHDIWHPEHGFNPGG